MKVIRQVMFLFTAPFIQHGYSKSLTSEKHGLLSQGLATSDFRFQTLGELNIK